MDYPEKIKTIASYNEYKFKEKGSLFIGQAHPVELEEEARQILESVKKKFYDATHHCYAYLLQDNTSKYSDDGEPSGTAGIRIINAINHFSLVNLLLISIRYYGGTKLGVGPLGKAYYRSAEETLASAKIIEKTAYQKIRIEFDFNHTSQIHHYLSLYNAVQIKNIFKTNPSIECLITPNQVKKMAEDLVEATKGGVKISLSGKINYL